MTTPTNAIPKNQGIGYANTPGRVGLEVTAPSSVRAEQVDVSGISSALDRFGAMMQERAEQKAAELTEIAGAQGFRDAALGKADETRMDGETPDSKAYRHGVNANRAEADGNRFVAESMAELDRAMQDPEFDFAQWQQDRIQQFAGDDTGNAQNPEQLKARNAYLAQFQQATNAKYAAVNNRLAVERSTKALADNLLSFRERGMTTPEQLAQWRSTRGARSGLEEHEIDAVVGSVLLDELAKGKLDAYDLAKNTGLLNAEWSPRFEQQRRSTADRLERERLDALEKDTVRAMRARRDLSLAAERGELTMDYLAELEQAGKITPQELNWAWDAQLRGDARRRDEAAERYEQAQHEAGVAALAFSGQEEILIATAGNPKLLREVRNHLDRTFAAAALDARSVDPKVAENGRKLMTSTIDQAQRNGMSLSYLKSMFDEADIGVPQRFEALGNLYREMVAQGRGDYLRNQVNGGAMAKMERYASLVDGGMAPSEAVAHIANSTIAPEEAQRRARGAGQLIETETTKLAQEMRVAPGLLQQRLHEYTVEHLSMGADKLSAVKSAVEMVRKRQVAVNGTIVPRNFFPDPKNPREPEEFLEALPRVKEELLLPKLSAKFGDIDDVEFIPNARQPGEFLMRRTGDSKLIVDEDGMPIAVTSESVRGSYLRLVREDAKKRNAERRADEALERQQVSARLGLPLSQ